MKYFPSIEDKKESSNIDNLSRESQQLTSTSTSTPFTNASPNHSTFLSGIVGEKGTAIIHFEQVYYLIKYQVSCCHFASFKSCVHTVVTLI